MSTVDKSILDGLSSLNIPSRNKAKDNKVSSRSDEPSIGDTFTVPLNKIVTDDQVRTKFDNDSISELAKTIELEGQRTPIEAAKLETDKYLLITGERRYLALSMLEASTARITLVPMPKDEIAKIIMQLTENIQREDLDALDLATAFDRLKTQGLTHNQIAQSVGKSNGWVSRHLKLIGLPDFLKKLLEEKHTSDIQLVSVLRKIADYDEKIAQNLALKVEQGRVGRQKAIDVYDALKSQAKSESSEETKQAPVDIKATHYSRTHHIIRPEQFSALVETRLADGAKVTGKLMIDRLATKDQEPQEDWCWIKLDTGEKICVETKKTKLLQILSN